jgi:LacI family transcriptional regulator
VILVRPETTFFSRLYAALARIAATLDAAVAVHRTFMDERDAAAIANRIARPQARRAGLILAVPDHPLIQAALAKVHAEGIPVIQIVTRAQGTNAIYVGIDNYAAGRTAAHFLSRMQPQNGTVIALCHSQVYQVHRERIRGFSDYLEDRPRDGVSS